MTAKNQKQDVSIDFLYFGTIQDYAKDVDTLLEESLQKATNLSGELEGRLFIASRRGEQLTLANHPLYHGNITFEFEYASKRPLPKHVKNDILPELIQKYVMPHLNSERCAVLKDIHSLGYLQSMFNPVANKG